MYNNEFNKLFNYAKNKVDDMDIVLSETKSLTLKAQKQKIENLSNSHTRGLGIRVQKNNNIGYAYTEDFSDESLKLIVDEAIENSKIIEKKELSFFENYSDSPLDFEVFNPELEKIDINSKKQIVLNLEKFAYEADKRVLNVSMSVYSDFVNYYKIANSKGLNKETKSNGAYAYLYVLVGDDSDKRNVFDYCFTRNFENIKPKELADKCVDKALNLLGKEDIKTGKYFVCFDRDAFASLMGTFWSIFSAKNVQEGKSRFKNMINTVIASQSLNLYDDSRDPNGINSEAFDSEGFPTKKTAIIENGILKSFLHNSVTAHKDKCSSTGNASRGYKSSLDIAFHNLKIEASSTSRNELFNINNTIVEIVSLAGLHSGTNPISGDFSLSCEGFLHQNGNKSISLKPFTVSGNFYDLLKNIIAFGDDFKYNLSSIGTPSILIKDLNISS